ncbi:MAG: primosomal protein N', partial [Pseudomonadota bacterium]|nr:primosomal protein N' [Pseudomonadota bacterium]
AQAAASEMWVQTWNPAHPLYRALAGHDFTAFAESQLQERESAGLPPFSHLAMLRAEARSADAARGFLQAAAECAAALPDAAAIAVYAPVPMSIARIANVERMQMLVESASRRALQRFLAQWLPALHALRRSRSGAEERVLRWAVDVDPLTI